jgi:serine/threonine protein phosphatase PrpC
MDISCEDGDIIVMVSDGAMLNGDDCAYLTDMLRDRELARETPSKIAEKLLRRAKAEVDAPSDDISIVVVKVKKDISNW